METQGVHSCPHCSRVFKKAAALLSHIKWMHEERCRNQCDRCGKIFPKKHYLIRHLESGFHDGDKIETARCSMCDFCGDGRKTVLNHYQEYHKVVLQKRTLCFKTIEEFQEWKTNFETETTSRFVKTTRTRVSKDGSRRSSFLCHRDGNFKPKGNNLRPLKRQGSNKINSHCPARIEVVETDNSVKVNCIETHVGHELDIGQISLFKPEELFVAYKKGRVSNKILDIKLRHELSLSLSEHCVVEVENSWTVGSPQNKDIYIVEKKKLECKCPMCCTECGACIHSYICSCVDSSVKGNMCKHIHLVCQFIINKGSIPSDAISNGSSIEISVVNEEQLSESNANSKQTDHDWEKRKKEAWNSFKRIYSMIENEIQLQAFVKQISTLENGLKALSESDATLGGSSYMENPNKKLKIESRFPTSVTDETKIYHFNNLSDKEKES